MVDENVIVADSANNPIKKDSQYHYWHDKVPQGENAAPKPEHKPIAVQPANVDETIPATTIENFAFMVRKASVSILDTSCWAQYSCVAHPCNRA